MNASIADVCQTAKNLAKNCGYAVFPCGNHKKPTRPVPKGEEGGFKDGSTDPERIALMWRNWPGPLIGVATGAMSGISVLDIDVAHQSAITWWLQYQHALPVTRTYRTRRGGLHLYFVHRPGLKCATNRPVRGIDVRATGGYVIHWYAAGLECLDHEPPAPWPEWLTAVVQPPAPKPAPPPERRRENVPGAIAGIVRIVRDAAEGERNRCLHWAAHRMRERIASGDIDRNEAEHDLMVAANECGLPDFEARRTIASAWRAA
jgi:hypothetical protein